MESKRRFIRENGRRSTRRFCRLNKEKPPITLPKDAGPNILDIDMRPSLVKQNIESVGPQPFMIRMSDGTVIAVPHTDQVLLSPSGRQLVFVARNDSIKVLDTAHITSIEFTPLKRKAA